MSVLIFKLHVGNAPINGMPHYPTPRLGGDKVGIWLITMLLTPPLGVSPNVNLPINPSIKNKGTNLVLSTQEFKMTAPVCMSVCYNAYNKKKKKQKKQHRTDIVTPPLRWVASYDVKCMYPREVNLCQLSV